MTGFALLSKNNYELHELKEENWKLLQTPRNNPIIAFVDGGNAEILKTPTAEIHRIRTAVVITSGQKLIMARQKDGFVLVKAVVDGEGDNPKLKHVAEFFDSSLDGEMTNGSKLEFHDVELAKGEDGAMGRAAGIARKLAELAAAAWAARKLGGVPEGSSKIIILDGTLETFNDKEGKEMKKLRDDINAGNVIVGAVAKTCSLLTDKGEALITAVSERNSGKGYIAVAEGIKADHLAAIAIARLNDSAMHLFRVECGNGEKLNEMLTALASQSNDASFPGYPYGLIMADRFARVSNADTELTKTKMTATADAGTRKLLQQKNAMNAHRILDSM